MALSNTEIQARWKANFAAGQAARRAVQERTMELAAVETEVAMACGRQRFPTDEELARIDAARARYEAAKAADQTARRKFKDGVI